MDAGHEEQESQYGQFRQASLGLERLSWRKTSPLAMFLPAHLISSLHSLCVESSIDPRLSVAGRKD